MTRFVATVKKKCLFTDVDFDGSATRYHNKPSAESFVAFTSNCTVMNNLSTVVSVETASIKEYAARAPC